MEDGSLGEQFEQMISNLSPIAFSFSTCCQRHTRNFQVFCDLRHTCQAVYIVQAQIAAKEQRAAAEQDQQWEEAQANATAEAVYKAKVNATLTTAAPKQYFGRRKVDWFT